MESVNKRKQKPVKNTGRGSNWLFLLGAFSTAVYSVYSYNRYNLRKQMHRDSLTGGMSSYGFEEMYNSIRNKIKPSAYSVILLDVMDFKLINEIYGTAGGNKILSLIYKAITRHIQKSDNEFAARSEMDRFFVFLNRVDSEDIQNWIDEVIHDIHRYSSTDFPRVSVKFKQGGCVVDDPALDIRTFQDRARIALQNENGSYRNRVALYNVHTGERIRQEHHFLNMLQYNLEHKRFLVYMQPKIGVKSGKIEGAEALIRWQTADGKLVFPDMFVPVLEKNGKIELIDLYVFESVCAFQRERIDAGKELYPVSVNLSRNHFKRRDFLDDFLKIADQYAIPRDLIEFELTETVFLDEKSQRVVKECIREMRSLGFRCSMDDFGSGYSSMGLLNELDIDVLKLDRIFFRNFSSPKAEVIIESMVSLAHQLGIDVVAEGVELSEQAEYLRKVLCDQIQGYYFSKPLPVDEFEKWEQRFTSQKNEYDFQTIV